MAERVLLVVLERLQLSLSPSVVVDGSQLVRGAHEHRDRHALNVLEVDLRRLGLVVLLGVLAGAVVHALELIGIQNLTVVIESAQTGTRGEVTEVDGSSPSVIQGRVFIGDQVKAEVAKSGD